MMDQNFEIRILVIFLDFFKFSKRRREVPLRLIWTIMVAAKLDHSRVLVTKFHQNRSTLKGRSAGQRHTDTQTDRQTDRQTRLKIRALQDCNRANRQTYSSQYFATAAAGEVTIQHIHGRCYSTCTTDDCGVLSCTIFSRP